MSRPKPPLVRLAELSPGQSGDFFALLAERTPLEALRAWLRLSVDYLATNPANRTAGQGLKCVGVGMIAVALSRRS